MLRPLVYNLESCKTRWSQRDGNVELTSVIEISFHKCSAVQNSKYEINVEMGKACLTHLNRNFCSSTDFNIVEIVAKT